MLIMKSFLEECFLEVSCTNHSARVEFDLYLVDLIDLYLVYILFTEQEIELYYV